MKTKLRENMNYHDMFNKEYFILRIPFLKNYKFFERKNGIEAQRVVYHENIQKMYDNHVINFKQFNISSEFIFYTQRINDITLYNFILKTSFHPMIEDGSMDELETKVMYLAIKSIGEKLSFSEELQVKDNQSIDENKIDEIINNINKTLFEVEKESEINNTPLFEVNKIKGGRADKLTPQDIADKFETTLSKVKSQILRGIKIEMEHTQDRVKAKEIATDHVAEYPDYYDRLKKMETKAEDHWKNKRVNEDTKGLIKRMLRENLEEGPFTRGVGAAAMSLATMLPSAVQSNTTNKPPMEKSDVEGKVHKKGNAYISTARGIAPEVEFANRMAVTNAQDQILGKLGLDKGSFMNVVVTDRKVSKNKNGTYTATVTISAILN